MPTESRLEDALAARATARELASPAEIDAVLDRLGAEVTAALAHACPVLLAVMHGGVFTATGLARRLDFLHEFDYVHLTRYGRSLEGGSIVWHVRPRAELSGRNVLIIDDILDHGATLAALESELADIGVARIHTAVLVMKTLTDASARPTPDFVGIHTGDRYVFGCGMDYKGFWRGLPALYALESR